MRPYIAGVIVARTALTAKTLIVTFHFRHLLPLAANDKKSVETRYTIYPDLMLIRKLQK
jgi:hypothetical protein